MRRPAIEYHPQRIEIEKDLIAGLSIRVIADKYAVSKSAVQRHRDKLPDFAQLAAQRIREQHKETPTLAISIADGITLEQEEGTRPNKGTVQNGKIADEGTKRGEGPTNYEEARQEVAAHSGQSILDQVMEYNKEVREIFNRTVEERPALALAAVREAVRLMELQGRLLGDLKSDTDVKIAIVLPEGLRDANPYR
jgi:hypothetical protein